MFHFFAANLFASFQREWKRHPRRFNRRQRQKRSRRPHLHSANREGAPYLDVTQRLTTPQTKRVCNLLLVRVTYLKATVMTSHSNTTASAPDEAALDHQVRAFLECRPLIQAHIRALVRDAALAEDVFQEVWLRFERVTRHGELVANVPAWCRAAARLVALEGWRKQRREQPTTDSELSALVEQSYEEQDARAEFWSDHSAALLQCLDGLPTRSRDLITRRYRNQQPLADIAAQLGQSLGSVKTALCRLRIALAECVRKRIKLNLA